MKQIKPYREIRKGIEYWVVQTTSEGGKRHRQLFRDKEAAKQAAQTYNKERAILPNDLFSLSVAERAEIAAIRNEAQQMGVTLRSIFEDWKRARPVFKTVTLEQAIAELKVVQKTNGTRDATVKEQIRYLTSFAKGREEIPLSHIRADDIQEWFDARQEPPTSRQSNHGRFGALFRLATERKWVSENPMDFVRKPKAEEGPPTILTVEQAKELLEWTVHHRKRMLGYLVFTLFAGVRPGEAMRLGWDSARLDGDEPHVVVQGPDSKTSRRRITYLLPSAVLWFRVAKAVGGVMPLKKAAQRDYLQGARKVLGFKQWPKDILRHSCASYWLGLTGEAQTVSTNLGHSINVLYRHYRELVLREDARKFWAIVPEPQLLASPKAEAAAPPE
jgi:integrase